MKYILTEINMQVQVSELLETMSFCSKLNGLF
jgi:hypothetical protein